MKKDNETSKFINPEEFRHHFSMLGLSLVIVQNPLNEKFLTVRETRNRGWWIPAGKVDPPEDF